MARSLLHSERWVGPEIVTILFPDFSFGKQENRESLKVGVGCSRSCFSFHDPKWNSPSPGNYSKVGFHSAGSPGSWVVFPASVTLIPPTICKMGLIPPT